MQSAWNRNDYVRIIEENIKKGEERNFKRYNESYTTQFGLQYDYKSIMHYGKYAFSKLNYKYPTVIAIVSQGHIKLEPLS